MFSLAVLLPGSHCCFPRPEKLPGQPPPWPPPEDCSPDGLWGPELCAQSPGGPWRMSLLLRTRLLCWMNGDPPGASLPPKFPSWDRGGMAAPGRSRAQASAGQAALAATALRLAPGTLPRGPGRLTTSCRGQGPRGTQSLLSSVVLGWDRAAQALILEAAPRLLGECGSLDLAGTPSGPCFSPVEARIRFFPSGGQEAESEVTSRSGVSRVGSAGLVASSGPT